MKRQKDGEALSTFQRLTTAAEAFANRAPKVKRIDAERTALVNAIADAQLTLSMRRLPPAPKPSKAEAEREDVGRLKRDLKAASRRIAALECQLRGLKEALQSVRESAERAESVLERALADSGDKDEVAA